MSRIPLFRPFPSGRASGRLVPIMVLLCLIGPAGLAGAATEEETRVNGAPLSPCPGSPNCVSTIEAAEGQAIAPYRFQKPLYEAKALLIQIFSAFPRTELVEEKEEYLHFEVRSFVFGFVDDVEFWFDGAEKTIHFRSASRSGYYDFGVNRKRMEELQGMLDDQL